MTRTLRTVYQSSDEEEDDDQDHYYLIPEPKQPEYYANAAEEGMAVSGPSVEEILAVVEPLLIDSDTDKEMNKIRDFDCKCASTRKENSLLPNVSCIKKLSVSDVYQMRLDYAALSPECRDIAIMAIYAALSNDSAMTQRTKKVNVERKQCRTNYTIKATVVCRATFCFAFG